MADPGDLRPGVVAHRVPLAEWMASHGVGDQQLARALGAAGGKPTHRSTVSRLRRGLYRASPELEARVREITGGAVDLQTIPAGMGSAGPDTGDVAPVDVQHETLLFEEAFDFVGTLCEQQKIELATLDERIDAARDIVHILAAAPLCVQSGEQG